MSTKRERFLDWLRHGSPEQVPVMFGPASYEVASARLGKPLAELTGADAIAVAECLAAGAPGGGYMLSSSNSIHSSVRPENYLAMIRAAQRSRS